MVNEIHLLCFSSMCPGPERLTEPVSTALLANSNHGTLCNPQTLLLAALSLSGMSQADSLDSIRSRSALMGTSHGLRGPLGSDSSA